MTKLIFAALTLAAATAPAVAAPGPVRTVAADNRVISYTIDQRSDGSLILASAPREPSSFRLRVKDGWVRGDVAGSAVSFRAPQPKPARTSAD